MDCKLKKMWPSLAISLVALTSAAHAADDMQMRNIENRVSALEQRKGANGMINPPAKPVVKDGADFFLEAQALYLHATEDGMDFAIENNSAASFLDGRVKNARYDWNWGFRIGAGYNLPHDGWDLFLNWTWFHSRGHQDKNALLGQVLIATRANASDTEGDVQAVQAEHNQRLHLNLIDLEIGREFFVSKSLTFRPHMGLRTGWIYRNFDVEYAGGTQLANTALKDTFHNRYRGMGLRSGFDTQWGLGNGVSLYGELAASLLYGRHHVHGEEVVRTSPTGTSTPKQDTHNRPAMMRAMMDLGAGLRWDHLFYDDSYRIRLQAGWEQHVLFGFNRDIDFGNQTLRGKFTSNRGDLALSGVSFKARFDF